MGIAATISKQLYGTSDDPAAPENQCADFILGYEVGKTGVESDEAIFREWDNRGRPTVQDTSFRDWKRGYWAAKFHIIEGRISP